MALSSRLATGCGLHRGQQSFSGAPICGRERCVVAGAPFGSGNALPTSTSLPRLGPESPLRIRTPGDVVVDTALLAAPVRRAGLPQVENPTDFHQDGEWDHDGRDGRNGGPSVPAAVTAAAAPPPPPEAVAAGRAYNGWTGPSPRRGAVPEPVDAASSGAEPRAARLGETNATSSRQDGRVDPSTGLEWTLRSPEQQHTPSSPPSASTPAAGPSAGGAARGRVSRFHGASGVGAAGSDPRRHDALLSRVLGATNWYELRAVLISGGGGGGGAAAAALASSPGAVVAVLRRLAAVASYDMRPPESAQLGSFLERWLLQHTGALALMGPAELSLCLHSLAKLARAVPAPPPAWTAAWFAAAQPYLLQCGFRPKDLSLSLWALSKLQLRLPPAAVQLLLAAAEPHLPRFNGQDMSLLALALSALQARSVTGGGGGAAAAAALPSLLPGAAWQAAFIARCGAVLPECGSQGLANLLHGIVRAGLPAPDWLLGDLCASLYGKLPECNPQALANVLSALAAAGYVPEEGWVERFLAESAARMAHGDRDVGPGGGCGGGVCNLDDLTHLAAAAAQLALAPPRWWLARLYGAMELHLPRGSPRQLAQLLHAVAQLYRSPSAAAAPAPPPPRSLLAAWHRTAAATLAGFNAIDAAHSLWALAALGERPPGEWLQRLLVSCRGGLAAAPPGDLSVLAWSLAALRFRPTWAWLADVAEASEPALSYMNGQDFAMLSTAFVRLGCRPPRSWSAALLAAVGGRLGALEDRALSQTAWALYRLRVQPPPEWLEAMAGELARRWGARAAEATAAAGGRCGGSGEGGKGGGEELRHTVVLLWVMCMWLGGQQRREREQGPGRGRGAASGRKPRLRLKRGGGGGAAAAAQVAAAAAAATSAGVPSDSSRESLPEDTAGLTTGTPTNAAAAAAAPGTRRSCRITGRMLRRRRAAKPDHLVAGLGGDARAAAAFRRRIADQLLGPAMDATAPALAAGCCTPQDLALLAAAARRLPVAARRGAAARPAWRRALLAAAAPCLAALPPAGLVQLLGGLEALLLQGEQPLGPEWAAAAAAATGAHLAAPHLPAATKVALLRGLCRLRVSSSPPLSAVSSMVRRSRGREMQGAAAAEIGPGSPWAPVLGVGLRTMRNASTAAEPLLLLEVELLKARVRLRKLGPLAGPAGAAAAAAALRRLASARGATAAEYDAAALTAAAEEVRTAVTAAAAKAAAAGVAASDEDGDGDAAGRVGRRGPRRQRGGRVPAISEAQRAWIWARARRTVASRVADASPVLVVQLVELVSAHGLLTAATTPPAPQPEGTPPPTASSADAAGPPPPSASDAQCRAASLRWLAAATSRWWRKMLPVHRARVVLAWRRLLGPGGARSGAGRRRNSSSSGGSSSSGSDSGSSKCGSGGSRSNSSSSGSGNCGRGNDEVGLEAELRAALPAAVTSKQQQRRWRPQQRRRRPGGEPERGG